MRRLAALALVLLAGCGGDAPSAVVPADARVYVGVSEAEPHRWPRELDHALLVRHAGAGTMAVQGEGVQIGSRISELPGFLVEVGERLVIETDEALGGSGQELGDTRRYRDAERRLGGPPTMLFDTRAARDDGRGTLRILRPAGG